MEDPAQRPIERISAAVGGPAIAPNDIVKVKCLEAAIRVFTSYSRKITEKLSPEHLQIVHGLVAYIQRESHKRYRDAFYLLVLESGELECLTPCTGIAQSGSHFSSPSQDDESIHKYLVTCKPCKKKKTSCPLNDRYLAAFLSFYTNLSPVTAFSLICYLKPADSEGIPESTVTKWADYLDDKLSNSPRGIPRPVYNLTRAKKVYTANTPVSTQSGPRKSTTSHETADKAAGKATQKGPESRKRIRNDIDLEEIQLIHPSEFSNPAKKRREAHFTDKERNSPKTKVTPVSIKKESIDDVRVLAERTPCPRGDLAESQLNYTNHRSLANSTQEAEEQVQVTASYATETASNHTTQYKHMLTKCQKELDTYKKKAQTSEIDAKTKQEEVDQLRQQLQAAQADSKVETDKASALIKQLEAEVQMLKASRTERPICDTSPGIPSDQGTSQFQAGSRPDDVRNVGNVSVNINLCLPSKEELRKNGLVVEIATGVATPIRVGVSPLSDAPNPPSYK